MTKNTLITIAAYLSTLLVSVFLFLLLLLEVCANPLWPLHDDSAAGDLHEVPLGSSLPETAADIPGADEHTFLEMITIQFPYGLEYDTFILGEDVEDVTKEVNVYPFRLAKYELSYNLWHHVYQWAVSEDRGNAKYIFAHAGSEGSYTKKGESNDTSYGANTGKAPQTTGMPVAGVSWRDAVIWCNAFSEMCGLRPVYYTDAALTVPLRNVYYSVADGGKQGTDPAPGACNIDINTVKPGGIDNPYIDNSAGGYRLPYECEWEYAARKKSDGSFRSGKSAAGDNSGVCHETTLLDEMNGIAYMKSTKFNDYAWNMSCSAAEGPAQTAAGWNDTKAALPADMANCNFRTHKQGGKKPSDLGFYDMSGNVNEWCFDFAIPYSSARKTYTLRSCRGGVFQFYYGMLQTGARGGTPPHIGGAGIRLAQNLQ